MKSFFRKALSYETDGYDLCAAVETTGNARYFRNRLITRGINFVVINTMKFNVDNESVKMTDKRDARTLAELLEKDMLPESILCSQESEDLRKVLKSRSIPGKALVSVKNQVHGSLLGYGIEPKRGQLQSRKERRESLTVSWIMRLTVSPA